MFLYVDCLDSLLHTGCQLCRLRVLWVQSCPLYTMGWPFLIVGFINKGHGLNMIRRFNFIRYFLIGEWISSGISDWFFWSGLVLGRHLVKNVRCKKHYGSSSKVIWNVKVNSNLGQKQGRILESVLDMEFLLWFKGKANLKGKEKGFEK